MNASAAALWCAVTGIASPSGSPKDEPGPFTPGTNPPVAWPAIFDCEGSLAVGMFPGPAANSNAASPALKLFSAGISSTVTDPGDTQPFFTAEISHSKAFSATEFACPNTGLLLA